MTRTSIGGAPRSGRKTTPSRRYWAVPIGIWALATHSPTPAALGRAAAAGVLCSAVPMVADQLALRRVPAGYFGVFMSVNPVFAALAGLAILHQALGPADWLAIAAIVAANATSAATQARRRSQAVPQRRPGAGARTPAQEQRWA